MSQQHSNQQSNQHRSGCVASRTEGFVQVRLAGPVSCRTYYTANAFRLGNVTLILCDRQAAVSIARAAVLVADIAPRLGHSYARRHFAAPASGNVMTTLIELVGTQKLSTLDLRAGGDSCGQASFTLGNLRITVCDRDAAEAVATALIGAYGEACHTFPRLLSFDDVQAKADHHRAANKARRRGVRL